MKRAKALAVVVSLWVLVAGIAQGQNSPPDQAAGTMAPVAGYNSLYCGGFITDRAMEESLFVIAGEEGGMKNEFIVGDVLFLSKGSAWITNPSGEYLVVRPVRDFVKQEAFRGQRLMMERLGTMYVEVGRIRVNIVHQDSASAVVLHNCESITVGDLAIPFNVKPAPPLKPSAGFDRYAPPTGKTGGMILSGKEYAQLMGTGGIAYLDIGANQGVGVGQYYRIYRPYLNYKQDTVWRYMHDYLEKATGVRLGLRLTYAQQLTLPREVLGEMVITHVEGRSATALITFLTREAYVGDYVELE